MVTFTNFAHYLQQYGVMDFLLPFILVFTIIFAVAQKIPLLNQKKAYSTIVALVLALFFTVPHIIGYYPLGYDPVQVLNESLPSVALLAVAAVMLLILLGLFGSRFSEGGQKFVAFFVLAFVGYIFGAALNLWKGPYDIFYWWTAQTTELLIIVLVFGLVVWFVTSEPSPEGKNAERLQKGAEALGKIFEKND